MAKKPSVYGPEKVCYICKSPYVEIHHIWQSDRRIIADREGLTVPLCHYHHQDPRYGVHGDANLREFFRRDAQRRWEEREGIDEPDHETFIALVGENYL